MGGRGSWSSSGGMYEPHPGGGNGGAEENVIGPRIPSTLSEALGEKASLCHRRKPPQAQIPITTLNMMRTLQIARGASSHMRHDVGDTTLQHSRRTQAICSRMVGITSAACQTQRLLMLEGRLANLKARCVSMATAHARLSALARAARGTFLFLRTAMVKYST